MRPIQSFERELPCNWKVVLENAMDLYHVPVVHSRSVSRYVDTQPELTKLGDHSRQRIQIARYGWRQRLDEACSRGGPYTPLQRSAMHKYFVFPNFLINVLPFHLTVMQVFPIDPTSCLLRYSFCRRKGARGLELARALATWLASRWILREDLGILQRFQDGVATGRVSEQLFHEGEGAGAHLHGARDRWLAASPR